jgi:hypothetical protein
VAMELLRTADAGGACRGQVVRRVLDGHLCPGSVYCEHRGAGVQSACDPEFRVEAHPAG